MAQEIKGTVKWFNSEEDVVDGIVVAFGPDEKVNRVQEYTNADGNYVLDLSQQPAGRWTVQVFHPEGLPSVPVTRDIVANVTPDPLNFHIRRPQTSFDKFGTTVFGILIAVFFATVFVYLALHQNNPPELTPIDAKLDAFVLLAKDDPRLLIEDEPLGNFLEEPISLLGVVAVNEGLSDAEKMQLTAFSDRIRAAVSQDNRPALREELGNLYLHLRTLTRTSGFFWTEDPWRMMEIYLVALIAVLGSKIIETGHYLRRGSFYPEGIYTHLSHILVNPLFVVAVVLFVSLGSVEVTLANESSIRIDVSNPIVLITVSFLLGIVPWQVLRFIQDAAERILGNRNNQ